MKSLFLSSFEGELLSGTIAQLEAKTGSNEYVFEPADMMVGCTCEGNCDGVPSGCTWH